MLLVTGATGNIGQALVPELVAGGELVRVLVRDPARAAALGNKIEIVQGDLDHPDSMEPAFHGVDRAFMLAMMPRQEAEFIAAAQRAGVQQIVMLSSGGVPFGVGGGPMHEVGERLLMASEIPWVILRPSEFMSNALRWVSTIRSQGAVFEPVGDGKAPLIDPVDIAAVAANVLTTSGHEGRTYELTGPAAISRAEMVATISTVLGTPLRFIDVPEAALSEQLVQMGMPAAAQEAYLKYYRMVKAGALEAVSPAVEQLIGRKARDFAAWTHEHRAAFA